MAAAGTGRAAGGYRSGLVRGGERGPETERAGRQLPPAWAFSRAADHQARLYSAERGNLDNKTCRIGAEEAERIVARARAV